MPGLVSLALASPLRSLREEVQHGEGIFAFLDDAYIAASPDRATHFCDRLEYHLCSHARLRLDTSKSAFGRLLALFPLAWPSLIVRNMGGSDPTKNKPSHVSSLFR